MLSLIVAESAIFTIFLAAYIFYIGKSLDGPIPRQLLTIPIFATVCLLSSSLTMHAAIAALRKGKSALFNLFWILTLVLGVIFIASTAREWHHLIHEQGFTIQTNLFGTTFYSLVGLHASHVIVGLTGLTIVAILGLAGKVRREYNERCEVIALYWHFVDAVWVVVFTVVYIVGR
jgi:cytochrome c oxidase subunit 3/cytochrome o ubiquinol oxidase subunit 3